MCSKISITWCRHLCSPCRKTWSWCGWHCEWVGSLQRCSGKAERPEQAHAPLLSQMSVASPETPELTSVALVLSLRPWALTEMHLQLLHVLGLLNLDQATLLAATSTPWPCPADGLPCDFSVAVSCESNPYEQLTNCSTLENPEYCNVSREVENLISVAVKARNLLFRVWITFMKPSLDSVYLLWPKQTLIYSLLFRQYGDVDSIAIFKLCC